MNYKKIQYPRATDTSAVRLKPSVPVDCISLYKTSFNFDITSANDLDRCEYWSSAIGTMSETEVTAEVYGGKTELEAVGFKTLTAAETLSFTNVVCDMLEVVVNNLSDSVKLVKMQASSSSQTLETINVAIGEIVTVTIPKPYNRYTLACPAGTFIKLNQYVL